MLVLRPELRDVDSQDQRLRIAALNAREDDARKLTEAHYANWKKTYDGQKHIPDVTPSAFSKKYAGYDVKGGPPDGCNEVKAYMVLKDPLVDLTVDNLEKLLKALASTRFVGSLKVPSRENTWDVLYSIHNIIIHSSESDIRIAEKIGLNTLREKIERFEFGRDYSGPSSEYSYSQILTSIIIQKRSRMNRR